MNPHRSVNLGETTPVGIPVGTIVVYAADLQHLPAQWHECDGTSFPKDKYQQLFKAIGYANGGAGNAFNIPDLQGRFIQGVDERIDLIPGKVSPWTTGPAAISVEFDQVPAKSVAMWRGTKIEPVEWHDEPTWFPLNEGDKETRPVNIGLYYIIKIIPTPANTPGDDIPLGAIIPHAGSDNEPPPNFPEYIRCDGSTVDSDQVQELADLVGSIYTPIPSTKSLTVPDIRGKFIRGVDPKAKHDPDASTRETAPNGKRQGPGTWQSCATSFKNMKPGIWFPHYTRWYQKGTSAPSSAVDVLGTGQLSNHQQWKSKAKETRPFNAAIHFYINSHSPDKAMETAPGKQVFPIGGIIAIAGTPDTSLPLATWLPCDGKEWPESEYNVLCSLLKGVWTPEAHTAGTFCVPNLNACFLRGADLMGVDNGDPDWNHRYRLGGPGDLKGAGTYQHDCAGLPRTPISTENADPLHVSAKYAVGHHRVWAHITRDRTSQDTALQTGPMEVPIHCGEKENKWAQKTAPVSVVVRFFIRAQ